MIVDFHCHLFHLTDAQLSTMADMLVRVARRRGNETTKEEVISGLKPMLADNDPSGENFVQNMDNAGIDVSVCFPYGIDNLNVDYDTLLKWHKDCAEMGNKYPGRIIPFAFIDPRREKAPDMLRKCVEEFGMRGLKLHPDEGYSLTSQEGYKLIEVAHQHGLVLVTHTGPVPPPARSRNCHPLVLDDIACDFPGLKIVAAHSGGLWQSDWVAIQTPNPNMYGDLAGWQLDAAANYERFCQRLRGLLDMVGPGKLLFASDWLCFEPFISRGDWADLMRRLPECSPAGVPFKTHEVDAILGGNAKKILGL